MTESQILHTPIKPMTILGAAPKIAGVRVGYVVGMPRDSSPLVDFPGNPFGPAAARRTRSVTVEDVSAAFQSRAPVLLTFEDNDPGAPIVFDVVDGPVRESGETANCPKAGASNPPASPKDATLPADRRQPRNDCTFAKIVSLQDGQVRILWPGSAGEPQPARVAVALRNLVDDVIVLKSTSGEAVIVGQLFDAAAISEPASESADVVLRGHTIRIEATNEVVLTAGACEIRLDARGKATTTADHVVSRARGVNKVQGGSVRLN
jgi:hypothetical protein